MGIVFLIVFILLLMQLSIWYNAFRLLKYDKIRISLKLFQSLQFLTGVGFPILFLGFADFDQVNECCGDSSVFAPDHKVGIYVLIVLYLISFSISVFRERMFPPIPELALNVFLMLGLIINGLIAYHISVDDFGEVVVFVGTLPVVIIVLFQLAKNHRMHQTQIEGLEVHSTFWMKWVYLVLRSNWIQKSVILILLCAPIVVLFSLVLMIFGQKPDTLVQAFTQTYKHGFSELDYECANVQCGGHFLCSVGALGNQEIVHPIRYGVRNGENIVCTRQLLISNAFEEVIETQFPKLHNYIRGNYNQVGNVIHKYYYWFELKWVSNSIYVLMKPLEWFFLAVLYCVDQNPENRINRQYLKPGEMKLLKKKIQS